MKPIKAIVVNEQRTPEVLQMLNEYRDKENIKSGINALENLVKYGMEHIKWLRSMEKK